MKKTGVALLGLGTVGGGTYRILQQNRELIKKAHGLDIEVIKILDRDYNKSDALNVDRAKVTFDIDDIISDPSIGIVAEAIGGINPAKSFLIKALEAGKSVVTANKELCAKCWDELNAAAKKGKAGFYFEASCVGGVPIIRTLMDGMQANNILEMKGIVNGTTNYILSAMTQCGTEYSDALKEAQRLGYAEANPTADVDGFDASYKISILSTLAFHKHVPLEKVYREGISSISVEDINYGKELGMTLKLLAIAKNNGGKIEARVHPAFVDNAHPLATVSGSFNAVHLLGDMVGDIMLYGRGAGDLPTGSAIVSDIVYAANKGGAKYNYNNGTFKDSDFAGDFTCKYYIRMNVSDKSGTLGKIATVFGKNKVSLQSVLQKDVKDGFAPIVFTTHETGEKNMQKALAAVKELDSVIDVAAVIRIE